MLLKGNGIQYCVVPFEIIFHSYYSHSNLSLVLVPTQVVWSEAIFPTDEGMHIERHHTIAYSATRHPEEALSRQEKLMAGLEKAGSSCTVMGLGSAQPSAMTHFQAFPLR